MASDHCTEWWRYRSSASLQKVHLDSSSRVVPFSLSWTLKCFICTIIWKYILNNYSQHLLPWTPKKLSDTHFFKCHFLLRRGLHNSGMQYKIKFLNFYSKLLKISREQQQSINPNINFPECGAPCNCIGLTSINTSWFCSKIILPGREIKAALQAPWGIYSSEAMPGPTAAVVTAKLRC